MTDLALNVLIVIGAVVALVILTGAALGLVVAVCLILACGWMLIRDSYQRRVETRRLVALRERGDRQWSEDELVIDQFERWFALPDAPDPRWLS